MKPKILIAEDESNMRRILQVMLEHEGYEPFLAANGIEGLQILKKQKIAVIITDVKMPKMDGLELLKNVTQSYPEIPVIMITAHGTIESAVNAMKMGAFDYITKPFEHEDLRTIVAKAVRSFDFNRLELHDDNQTAFPNKYRTIGNSPQMQEIYHIIDKVADSPSTVLITGESGTGKELIAHAIHYLSSRHEAPFLKINCAAIPETLIESELFGHERGAFTGAVSSKPGRFELANSGTLFLDEIGDIPKEIQVKLLRVLQDQEFERVGGTKTIKVNVRLVAATNKDLEKAVKEDLFRQDLFYRLNIIHIHLPPLRERIDDVPLLLKHCLNKFNVKLERKIQGITAEAIDILQQYDWPGNIRELENVLERAILLSEGAEITTADLPSHLSGIVVKPKTSEAANLIGLPFKEAVRERTGEVERQYIVQALNDTGGNVTKTAEILKISRKSLQLKMKEYGLRTREAG